MLAFAGLLLVGGTLGDLLGRKKVMLGGVALFCAGSLLGALADGTSHADRGPRRDGRRRGGVRAGDALADPADLPATSARAPARSGSGRRCRGSRSPRGPVLGGLLVAAWGWRGVFWFNLGFGLVALAVAAWTLPESSDPEGRSLDLPGLVTGVVAVTALTFAVIEGENAGLHDPVDRRALRRSPPPRPCSSS